jgi:membrane protease YdiL (CAAX protease family)
LKSKYLIVLVAAAAIVWLVASDLPWPARAFTVLLTTAFPALAIAQVKALRELPSPLPRPQIYISSIISLWLLATIGLVAAVASGYTALLMGLHAPPAIPFIGWTLFGIAAAAALYLLTRWLDIKESPLLVELLPKTRTERIIFVFVAITAGFCEELVFRGFLIPSLTVVAGGGTVALLLSSALFGVLHSYQSWLGVLRAGALGALLAVPFLVSGSILPSMLSHTLIDIIGGVWLGREAQAEARANAPASEEHS